ncbi:phage tail protein [Thaumasiovibrio subtropicus]|uniref:phage tail protein n=1 Tax=Thaumasiovibrio subtropicus TaxID=1891207 RepID=UPI000B35CEFF|nr:phage tail protein [Thaumasiovibrio subtropicus]
MGKKKSQVVGHRWYWGQHLVLCHGPVDAIIKIWFGEKVGWSGYAFENDEIHIDKPTLFGDRDQYGGVVGNIDVLLGHADQDTNTYLYQHCAKTAGGKKVVSAFRYLTSLVFKTPEMGNSSYPPPVSVEVARIKTGWDGNPIWYAERANPGTGLNAAHVLHELVECPEWGVGNSDIDDAAFKVAADKLFNERFGLNAHWTRQQPVEDFIKDICRYINGYVYTNESSGKITLKLARDDYVIDDLEVLTSDQIRTCRNVRRRSQADIINTLTVTYTDSATHEKAAITVMNSAMVNAVGRTVGETVKFPMIMDSTLAYKVAMRELKMLSSRLLTAEIYCDTRFTHLQPGDVVKVEYPPAGLNHVMRVQKKRRGTMAKPEIKLDVMEDVFSPTSGEYTPPPPSDWDSPLNPPMAIATQRLMEAPYWLLANTFNASELAGFGDDSGMLLWLAAKPTSDTLGAELYFDNTNRWTYSHRANFTPASFTTEAIDKHAIQVTLTDNALTQADLPMVCAINDELVVVSKVENGIASLTRAVLDTHPQHHPAMSWLTSLSSEAIDNEFIQGEQVKVRALTVTPIGILPDPQATIITTDIQARAFKPLPVCNVRLNGAYDPEETTLPITLSWLHRNRLSQVGQPEQLTSWYQGGNPEPGVETRLEIYDQDKNKIVDLITNKSEILIPNFETNPTKIEIILTSLRNETESQVKYRHSVIIKPQ